MSILATLALSLLPQDQASASPWTSHRLKNGVRVHVLQVDDAPSQAAFSFLPFGLANDPPGRAQFSHLAEHMLIRSSDSKRLRIGDIQLNGETTTSAVRLESFAPPAQWEASLVRHARWLTAREFDADVLAREKVRIAGEERGTVPRGYNHKWATAAWAQFIGGLEHAALHGDVANATVDQVQRYVAARVRLADAQMFLSGPTDAKELVVALERGFAKHTVEATAPLPGPTKKPAIPAGHREMTWDLDAGHYLEWYPMPADCTAAEAEMIARVVSGACYRSPFFTKIPGRALAVAAKRGGTRYLICSSNLPDGTKIADVRAAFRGARARAKEMASAQVRGEALATHFAHKPDFAAQRRMVAQPRMKKLIEAQFAMLSGYACVRLNQTIDRVPDAYRALRAERVIRLLTEHCTNDNRSSARIAFRAAERKKPSPGR